MRNIFLDCGANRGQSIELFLNKFTGSEEYEIYSFECSDSSNLLKAIEKTIHENKDRCKGIHFFKKAVWTEDTQLIFYDEGNESSSLLSEKTNKNPTIVEAIDLCSFIENNFSPEDNIILKIDIEGGEYEVLRKLIDRKTINYIDKLYGELHGPKCKKSYTTDVDLIDELDTLGYKMYLWDASNDLEVSTRFYTEQLLWNFHKKYNFAGGR